MPRPHGKQASTWWGSSTPTTGPTGTTSTWVGNVLGFTVPGRLAGMRLFDGTSTHDAPLFACIIDDSISPVSHFVAFRHINLAAGQSNTWHQIWFRPFVRVVVGHTYWVAAWYQGGAFFRNNAALSSAVTRNGIQFQSGFQSTAVDLALAIITTNTNANAVDVLFYPD